MLFSPRSTQRKTKSGSALIGSISISFVSFVVIATAVLGAATPQEMYLEALAREQAVRAALAQEDGEVSARTAAAARAVVGAYQEIVRVYPASGYSDNALWQGGLLSLDLFVRLEQERDRATGLRLLRLLVSEYPSSRRLRDVPEQLARAEKISGGAQAPPLPITVVPTTVGTDLQAGPNAKPVPTTVGTGLQAGPNTKIATIRNITRTVLPDAVRITIELDTEVRFHDERIPNPTRVFVDLPSTRATPALMDRTLRFEVDDDIVRQVRIGRHPNRTTRVVLDAAGVSSYSVYPLYNPYRLVIDCVREPGPAPSPQQSASVGNGLQTVPNPVAPSTAPPPLVSETLPMATSSISTTAPAKNVGGGYSMARQLGLSVSRIVIDPGHGGYDPGATGTSISEAALVLDIALRVEKLLQKVPGTEVILTRRTDDFVPLQERTAIANREGADLFLSIHANASGNPAARGVETYILNFATNMGAASVAARENAASGQAMGALPDFLKAIALNNKLDESRDFATEVQSAMVERLRKSNKSLKDLGVKQAPFVVLIGAAMPSVLAEISFVTNEQEARLLRGNTYRQRIAEALVNAIRKYQTTLKNVASVARQ